LLVSSEKEEEKCTDQEELLTNWMNAFAMFKNRIGHRSDFYSTLAESNTESAKRYIQQYDAMLVVFLQTVQLGSQCLTLLRQTQTVEKYIQSWDIGTTTTMGLTGMMEFASIALPKTKKEEEEGAETQRRLYFLQDLIEGFLSESKSNLSRLPSLLIDFQFFVENWQAALLGKGQSPFKLLRFEWVAGFLNSWLRGRPLIGWRDRVLEAIGNVIIQHRQSKKTRQYRFIPKWNPKSEKREEEPLPLEEILYYGLLAEMESKYLGQPLHQACRDLWERKRSLSETVDWTGEGITSAIEVVALGTVILQKAATELSTINNTNSQQQQRGFTAIIKGWPTAPFPVLQTVVGLLGGSKTEGLFGKDTDLYFFNQFGQEDVLLSLLKNGEALKMLGLNKWLIDDSITASKYSHFSFMLDGQSDLGKSFATFRHLVHQKNVEAFGNFVREELSGGSGRNKLRMFFVLVCYHDYFKRGEACAFLQGQLPAMRQALDINDREITAFYFLARGPQQATADPNVDWLQFIFSKEAHTPPSRINHTLTDVMVNCLAVTLGSPRESNHMYKRIFHLEAMAGTFCPGSAYERRNVDCGFVMSENVGVLTSGKPPIMGNHLRFRLALNSLVWIPFAWACLLDSQFYKKCTESHFLNYWKEDGEIQYQKGKGKAHLQRSNEQKVKHYIFSRASTFFETFCTNPEMQAQRIDGAHFLTECLLRLWLSTVQQHRPDALRADFQNAEQAIRYEDFMLEAIFQPVSTQYAALKEAYQTLIRANSHISTILKVNNDQSSRFPSPLLSFQVFQESCGSSQSQQGQQQQQQHNNNLLHTYLANLPKLAALEYLPRLASFYVLLNQVFARQLSEEETLSLTVPAAIALLEKQKAKSKHKETEVKEREKETSRRNNNKSRLRKAWDNFKGDWKFVRETLIELEGQCLDQRINRAFEAQIPDVTDETLIATLLTFTDDGSDAIIKVLTTLVNLQEEILKVRDNYLESDKQQQQLSFFERPADYSIHALLHNLNCQHLLLSSWPKRDFEDYVLLHARFSDSTFKRASLNFDIPRIERKLLEHTCGKARFSMSIETFKCRFILRPAMIAPPSEQLHPEEGPNSGETTSTTLRSLLANKLGIYPLFHLAKRIPDSSAFAQIIPEQKLTWLQGTLKETQEGDILKLADVMKEILQHLLNDNGQIAPKASTTRISSITKSLNVSVSSIYFKSIGSMQICYAKRLALLLTQKYWQKDFLFVDVPSSLQAQLQPAEAATLDALNDWLLSKKPHPNRSSSITALQAERWYWAVKVLTEVLMDPINRNTMPSRPGASMRQCFAEEIEEALFQNTKNAISREDLDDLLPGAIRVENYSHYMRKLHALHGELAVRLQLRKNAENKVAAEGSDKATAGLYTELIPNEAKLAAATLRDEIVPMPLMNELGDMSASRLFDEEEMMVILPEPTYDIPQQQLQHRQLKQQEDRDSDKEVFASFRERLAWCAYKERARVNSTYTAGLKGLPNLGNTCWFNAALQCLCHSSSPFAEFLRRSNAIETAIVSQLQGVMKDIHEDGDEAEGRRRTVPSLLPLKQKMLHLYPQFSGNGQHDVQEFLSLLLHQAGQEMPELGPLHLFEMNYRATCQSCKNVSESSQLESFLQLPLHPTEHELSKLLAAYLSEQHITDWSCDNTPCTSKLCTMQSRVKKTSPLLMIQLKRFAYEKDTSSYKRNDPITLPLQLHFGDAEFTLFATCNHSGDLQQGHNYAHVHLNGQWYEISDEVVRTLLEDEVLTQSALVYLAFYKRSGINTETERKEPAGHQEKEPKKQKREKGKEKVTILVKEEEAVTANAEKDIAVAAPTTQEIQHENKDIQEPEKHKDKEGEKEKEQQQQEGKEKEEKEIEHKKGKEKEEEKKPESVEIRNQPPTVESPRKAEASAPSDSSPTVLTFLKQLRLERLLPIFEQHEVEYEDLPYLSEHHLDTMGISIGPKVRLLKAIASLPKEE